MASHEDRAEHEDKRPAAEPDKWPISIKLNKPVRVFKDTNHHIEFREPTGQDTRAVLSNGDKIIEFDPFSTPAKINPMTSGMLLMMARLSGWPSVSIDMMDPRDQSVCAWRLSPFFMPMAAED